MTNYGTNVAMFAFASLKSIFKVNNQRNNSVQSDEAGDSISNILVSSTFVSIEKWDCLQIFPTDAKFTAISSSSM